MVIKKNNLEYRFDAIKIGLENHVGKPIFVEYYKNGKSSTFYGTLISFNDSELSLLFEGTFLDLKNKIKNRTFFLLFDKERGIRRIVDENDNVIYFNSLISDYYKSIPTPQERYELIKKSFGEDALKNVAKSDFYKKFFEIKVEKYLY